MQVLTLDVCFLLVSLGNNNFRTPVKDKGFSSKSVQRGDYSVVLVSRFPPKGT